MKDSYNNEQNWPLAYGMHVIFVDPVGKPYDALVTAIWGPNCINIVIVNRDEGQTDTYGRKIERFTSVMHRNYQEAHGNYWYDPINPDNVNVYAQTEEVSTVVEASTEVAPEEPTTTE